MVEVNGTGIAFRPAVEAEVTFGKKIEHCKPLWLKLFLHVPNDLYLSLGKNLSKLRLKQIIVVDIDINIVEV